MVLSATADNLSPDRYNLKEARGHGGSLYAGLQGKPEGSLLSACPAVWVGAPV